MRDMHARLGTLLSRVSEYDRATASRLSKTTRDRDTAVCTLASVSGRPVFAFGPVPGYIGQV